MTASLDPETVPIELASHLVIDKVAGRETILWRAQISSGDLTLNEAGIVIGWQSGRDIEERFDTCGTAGCLAEADPAIGADIAGELWSGRTVTIATGKRSAGEPMIGHLPAAGFRQGLTELIKLWRSENLTPVSGATEKDLVR